MNWPTDLRKLMKRISTPAEEVFKGLEVLGNYIKAKPSGAQDYFVDEENGNDFNDGKSPDRAFASIEKACGRTGVFKDDYSDDALCYVFVAPGNYVEDDIQFWGHGLHLIGIGIPGRDSGVHVIGEAGATRGVLELAASHVEVANICFESAGAKPVLYGIAMENCRIHDCIFFAKAGNTLDCMELKNTRDTIIERNRFWSFKEKGIHIAGGANQYFINSIIRDNFFGDSLLGAIGNSAKGIYASATCTCYGSFIENNRILMGQVAGSPIGIDNDRAEALVGAGTPFMISNNMVVITNGATPIESASSPTGILHNATQAGATDVDPN